MNFREHFVFAHRAHIFNVTRQGCYNTVLIRQATGHHVWTVSVEAPPGTSRWDLAQTALEAFKNGQSQISI